MQPLSVDIKDLLELADIGTFGTDIFIGKQPTDPSNCLTLYDTGGGNQDAKFALDEGHVQVMCRDVDYLNAYEKLKSVKIELEGKSETTINGSKIIGIWASSNIAFIKKDGNYRTLSSVNFRIIREPDTLNRGNRQSI